jgi:hypothetical protein
MQTGGFFKYMLNPKNMDDSSKVIHDPGGLFHRSKNKDVLSTQSALDFGNIGAKPRYEYEVAKGKEDSTRKRIRADIYSAENNKSLLSTGMKNKFGE